MASSPVFDVFNPSNSVELVFSVKTPVDVVVHTLTPAPLVLWILVTPSESGVVPFNVGIHSLLVAKRYGFMTFCEILDHLIFLRLHQKQCKQLQ